MIRKLSILGVIAVLLWWLNPHLKPIGQDLINKLFPQFVGKEGLIKVVNLKPGDLVKSPLLVEGEARGTWFFEASFPIRVLDSNGSQFGVGVAQAQGEWMTENFVPFKAKISFEKSNTERGTLVLEKDNPSGLPEHADRFEIPIRFR